MSSTPTPSSATSNVAEPSAGTGALDDLAVDLVAVEASSTYRRGVEVVLGAVLDLHRALALRRARP